jgi:hypothetical protein
MVDDALALSEVERLLLMAAAVHGLGPKTDLTFANTNKVVGQALEWAGLLVGEVRAAWENPGREYRPAIVQVYGALIRMARQIHRVGPGRPPERPGEPLFEASGNVGTAAKPQAFPHFTSCRLTARGEPVAQELLARNPAYARSGAAGP